MQLITVLTAGNQNRLPHAIAETEQLFIRLQKENGGAQLATPTRKQLWQQIVTAVAATDQRLTTTQLATIIIQQQLTIEQLPALDEIVQQQAIEYAQLQRVLAAVQQALQKQKAAKKKPRPIISLPQKTQATLIATSSR